MFPAFPLKHPVSGEQGIGGDKDEFFFSVLDDDLLIVDLHSFSCILDIVEVFIFFLLPK